MLMFTPQRISDVILVEPKRHGDDRGFFSETYRLDQYEAGGIADTFIQDNHSFSKDKGVIRGLHFQIPPVPQAKLVRCTRGAIWDVAVDIRVGSPTYGQHVGAELTAENGHQLYVPVGFAHGFCTLTRNAEVQYKVTGYYASDCDMGLAWDDPALAIDWPLGGGKPILSEKDMNQPELADLPEYFSQV